MKLNLELDRQKLAIIKRMITQMKKVCPSQTVFISFEDDGIKLVTEYNTHDLQFVDSFFNMGMAFFVSSKTLESKRAKNLIIIKVKDFQQFAANFLSIPDNSTSVSLVLSKEGETRFIKIKSTENDLLQTITRSEIYLHFEELTFPRIDLKRFYFQMMTRDLVRLLEMCYKAAQPLYLRFRVQKELGTLQFSLRNPNVCMVYDNLATQDYNEEVNGELFQHNFCISEKHVKQLALIAAIDEMVSISVLLDGGLSLEFWELNESNLIIAMKSFVVPQLDQVDEQGEQDKMEVERVQQNQQPLQQQQRFAEHSTKAQAIDVHQLDDSEGEEGENK